MQYDCYGNIKTGKSIRKRESSCVSNYLVQYVDPIALSWTRVMSQYNTTFLELPENEVCISKGESVGGTANIKKPD
jgi:hypothetical protein